MKGLRRRGTYIQCDEYSVIKRRQNWVIYNDVDGPREWSKPTASYFKTIYPIIPIFINLKRKKYIWIKKFK